MKTPATVQYIQNDPKISIKDLIEKSDDLITPYRTKNPTFIGYLLLHKNMVDFVRFLIENADKSSHKKLVQLMQSNNTTLHRTFADSTELAKEMLNSFDIKKSDGSIEFSFPDSQKLFAMGTFSRILTRAFDQWPQEMWQIFFSTEDVLVDIIGNLNLSCVVQEISDKFTDQHYPYISILMWNIFQAFVGEKYKYEPPIFHKFALPIEGSPDVSKLHQSLTAAHKKNIIFLLTEYIKSAPLNNELFDDAIYRYIFDFLKGDGGNIDQVVLSNDESNRFAFRLFEVAGLIDPTIYDYLDILQTSQSVYKKDDLVKHQQDTYELAKELLFKLLEKINNDNYQLLEVKLHSVLAYLASWTKSMNADLAFEIVTRCLTTNASQIRLLNLLKMVQYIIEDNLDWFGDFKSRIQPRLDELAKQHSMELIKDGQNESFPVLIDNVMTMNRLLMDSDFIQSGNSNDDQSEDEEAKQPTLDSIVGDLSQGNEANDIIENEKKCWAAQQFIELNEASVESVKGIDKLVIPVAPSNTTQ